MASSCAPPDDSQPPAADWELVEVPAATATPEAAVDTSEAAVDISADGSGSPGTAEPAPDGPGTADPAQDGTAEPAPKRHKSQPAPVWQVGMDWTGSQTNYNSTQRN